MVLVLLLGDLDIPHRQTDLPNQFKKLLVPGKIQQILCTGNLCTQQTYEYLRSLSTDLVCVSGDFDDFNNYPQYKVLRIQQLKLLLIHGHQLLPWSSPDALQALARQHDVDVVVCGFTCWNSSPAGVFDDGVVGVEAFEADGRFFVIPGSATGVYHGSLPLGVDRLRPSFVLLDVQGTMITAYTYQLVDGEVKVEKMEYQKK